MVILRRGMLFLVWERRDKSRLYEASIIIFAKGGGASAIGLIVMVMDVVGSHKGCPYGLSMMFIIDVNVIALLFGEIRVSLQMRDAFLSVGETRCF